MPSLRTLAVGVATLAAMAATGGCSTTGGDEDDPTPVPSGPDGRRLKPALAGLVVTEPSALDTVPYARFATINTTWAELEPEVGEYDFGTIDRVLELHPKIRFRLRIRTGKDAPRWLKEETGGCIDVQPATVNGEAGCIVRYWRAPFLERFAALMEALAARYERDQQVVDVANGACSTAYAEPFILGIDAQSLARLSAAGLTMTAQRDCIVGSTEAMMQSFDQTRVSISGHSTWEFVQPGEAATGTAPEQLWEDLYGSSWVEERALLNTLRDRYPGRIVLEDHGLGPDDEVCDDGEPAETASTWYCYLAGLPVQETPHGWQLTLNEGSMSIAVRAGVEMNACYLEYAAFQQLSETERREAHDALLANCRGT